LKMEATIMNRILVAGIVVLFCAPAAQSQTTVYLLGAFPNSNGTQIAAKASLNSLNNVVGVGICWAPLAAEYLYITAGTMNPGVSATMQGYFTTVFGICPFTLTATAATGRISM